jgi:Kdo2-lipid IVA lauroyltransferase/acyltransferase
VAERSRWSVAAIAEWGLVAGLAKLLNWLPESCAYALGEGAGRLACRLDRRHRAIAAQNLAAAFPSRYAPADLDRLVVAVFENLGRTAVDVARSNRLLSRSAGTSVEWDGYEHLLAGRARGKGVLVISAHSGPWELLPPVWVLREKPVYVVARPLDNPRLDDLLTAWRERGGNCMIRKRNAVRAILQVLRQGETAAILIDQHISEREGVVVPFFGRPASTASAPALIALRSGAAVLPVGITRQPERGRYRIRIGAEVPIRRSGDLKADLAENTARFTAAIEVMIREQPEQWFWVHRRWKTRQPVDARLRPPDTAPETKVIESGQRLAG